MFDSNISNTLNPGLPSLLKHSDSRRTPNYVALSQWNAGDFIFRASLRLKTKILSFDIWNRPVDPKSIFLNFPILKQFQGAQISRQLSISKISQSPYMPGGPISIWNAYTSEFSLYSILNGTPECLSSSLSKTNKEPSYDLWFYLF
jgi:hypothetical protein